jgi:CRISPR-associated protein Cmr2
LPEIFPWINTHPADSRVPNHSIYDHIVQSAAIATCIEDSDYPSFLLFTLGPVQDFIAKAKKTSDLWAGSFIHRI